ncbi:hypothetical protein ACJZ2D_016375 [Fusarium nematophilum]
MAAALAPPPAAAPAALPGTPHRNNLAYQMILDSSPQTFSEEPTPSLPAKRRRTAQPEYPKQPALAALGRSQQREKGPLGQGPLDPLISELGIFVKGIKQLAQAIDDIIDNASQQEKQTLGKLFQDIPTYLTSRIYGGQGAETTEGSKTWAAIAGSPSKPGQPSTQSRNKPTAAKASSQLKAEPLQVLSNCGSALGLLRSSCRSSGSTMLYLAARPSSNILGDLINTEATIEDEVIAQTGQRPIRLQPSRNTAQDIERKTWIASFLQPVKPFRLFGVSALSRQIEKKASIQRHNPGCQGYHTSRYCHRQQRCETCSQPLEEGHQQPCGLSPKCSNCYGPFPASHENCPAKPIRKNGDTIPLTKKELTAIRKIGQKSYLRAQQTDSQSTFAMSGLARTGRRASTSSSPTSASSEDEMEIEFNTQQPDQQLDQQLERQLGQQPGQQASNTQPASSQRRGRDLPRKNYNIANAFSSLVDEEA